MIDPPNPPVVSLNSTQVDQVKVTAATGTLSPDQESAKADLPLSNPVSSMVESDEVPPPVSQPLQSPSWNPIIFSDEDEEGIPSITWTWIQTANLCSLRSHMCMPDLC